MSKRSKAGGVLAALPRRIGGLFDLMKVAEEEIADGVTRHPDRARFINASFPMLCPPAGISALDPRIYRAHARELVDRVAALDGPPEHHKPLALGTKAEVLCALSELSLKAPPSQQYAALYELLFGEIFGAAAGAGGRTGARALAQGEHRAAHHDAAPHRQSPPVLMEHCWMSKIPQARPVLNAYCKKRLWIVWYETRPVLACGVWDRTRITVVADSTDEAYSEAAVELGDRLELRFPIRCYPLPTRGELAEADRAFEEP